MRTIMILALTACGDNLATIEPDGGVDAPMKHPTDASDACSNASRLHPCDAAVDATPADAPVLGLCSDVCPADTQDVFPWAPGGTYEWSYCLPSYLRCCDPAQPGASC